MPYCPNCGEEHADDDRFCSDCGAELDAPGSAGAGDERQSAVRGGERDDWNWLDPTGPFSSPRTALNYFNGVGLLLVGVALLLVVAGVDSPYAFLPEPLGILLILYLVVVIFVGLPLAGVLLLTDNVLGFLRHG